MREPDEIATENWHHHREADDDAHMVPEKIDVQFAPRLRRRRWIMPQRRTHGREQEQQMPEGHVVSRPMSDESRKQSTLECRIDKKPFAYELHGRGPPR